ncbi:hypothetical protein tloyanaT_16080 [Thalassotalea loyana]|uniref:Phospholipase/carboxylesterase/thioesterase domain-containing protein n=2 Tax=Thalassotalea loyana TaxID=280483 RepID=A0ABQ6HFU0_9GAMM|nr:hypothetical protein tloyanaT_16080 [Thalassotalea loyana]
MKNMNLVEINKKHYKSLALFGLLAPITAFAKGGKVFDTFPEKIMPDDAYVFYSHGYIVEGDNPTPEHPEWGVYDFPQVKAKLSDPSYNLIAYHRPKNTEPFSFAKQLADDVRKLLAAGVKPQNITLIGFSRGGALSILTNHELQLPDIKTIILAGCAGLVASHKAVKVTGNVYSIYETSDQVGSCQFLIDRSDKVNTFNEIAISTGKSHGAFYLPREEWLTPAKQWIKHEN